MYDLRAELHERFDIVYYSRGVLCWLKDLDEWTRIVVHFLKPGGVFYIMETHPLCNIFEEAQPGGLTIAYPYFHSPEPMVWNDEAPDYSDGKYIPRNPSYEWSWSVGDILNAIIKAGLQIEFFNEYERLFFKRYPGMVENPSAGFNLPKWKAAAVIHTKSETAWIMHSYLLVSIILFITILRTNLSNLH